MGVSMKAPKVFIKQPVTILKALSMRDALIEIALYATCHKEPTL
jgi:hypothetical protein